MGTKTRISTAIFGAVLMFFLGSNIPLITSMLGLTRRSNFHATSAALKSSALSSSAAAIEAAALAGGGGGGGGGEGKKKPPTKNELAAEVLRSVLVDDDRKLCSVRYPAGLTMTEEQKVYINDQRYFVVITLRNNEELLHHALYELLNVIARLGPRHVFVSVFENNSKDKTPQFLALFTDVLKLAGVAHNLVSTFTLARELEALKRSGKLDPATAAPGSLAAASLPAAGRLLSELEGREERSAQQQQQWLQAAVEAELMAQLSEGNEGGSEGGAPGRSAPAAASASHGEWWPEEEEQQQQQQPQGIAEEGRGAAAPTRAGAASPAALAAAMRRMLEGLAARAGQAEGTNNSTGAGGTRGRALGEEEERDMIALLTEGKWTGNRIEFLARVRNRSIRPLFSRKEKYDKLIVMNDAIFCAEDVLRLALHE